MGREYSRSTWCLRMIIDNFKLFFCHISHISISSFNYHLWNKFENDFNKYNTAKWNKLVWIIYIFNSFLVEWVRIENIQIRSKREFKNSISKKKYGRKWMICNKNFMERAKTQVEKKMTKPKSQHIKNQTRKKN